MLASGSSETSGEAVFSPRSEFLDKGGLAEVIFCSDGFACVVTKSPTKREQKYSCRIAWEKTKWCAVERQRRRLGYTRKRNEECMCRYNVM